MKRRALLVKYAEIALRGGNRWIYEKMLADSIRRNLAQIGDYKVVKEQGRFYAEPLNDVPDSQFNKALEYVAAVFGVSGVAPCLVDDDQRIDNVKALALAHLRDVADGKPFTFKIETTRSDKRYPMDSYAVSAAVGEYILQNVDNSTVDVHNPDFTVKVELRNNVYIYSTTIQGNGGLPPGSAGKAVLLLSGGFDSPVAGWLAAKRGVELTAVYFHSPPYTSERAKEKVKDLCERLAFYTGGVRLYVADFTAAQLRIRDGVPPEKLTIILKRAMLRAAEILAKRDGALALVTGDSVGQVASQTLMSIAAIDGAATIPLLRPLATYDKREIIDLARKIGTFDISARPYDDCCTLFVADHPETKPKPSIIESFERKILPDLLGLIDVSINEAELFVY